MERLVQCQELAPHLGHPPAFRRGGETRGRARYDLRGMTSRATNVCFDLFTDGACEGNPGPGGWAFVLRGPEGEREGAGGEDSTTNNRMELTAVVRGLEQVPVGGRVTLHSDSQYVTKGLSEWLSGWKRRGWRTTSGPVKNADLWKRLDVLAAERSLRTVWVRGHNGHPENERCDAMAVAAVPRSGGATRPGRPARTAGNRRRVR